jgi:hypothetical protein
MGFTYSWILELAGAEDVTLIGTTDEDSQQQTLATPTTGTTMTIAVTPHKRQDSMSAMSTAGDARKQSGYPLRCHSLRFAPSSNIPCSRL